MNQINLIGRVGRDAEIKTLSSGTEVASFSMATTETWKDRNGEKKQKTEWHQISCWAGLANIAGRFVKKGAMVRVTGKLEYQKRDDKIYANIRCDDLEILVRFRIN